MSASALSSVTSRHHLRSGFVVGWLVIASVLASIGCDRREPVVIYTIPTSVPEPLREGRQRMLAAMVPKDEQVWFFKVTGPEAMLGELRATFREFVSDIKWKDDEPALDSLPERWKLNRIKNSQFRFASIDVDPPADQPEAKSLDISVSKLTRKSNWDAMVSQNVNRWRGQLGLENSEEKWASAEPLGSSKVADAVWVDLVGQSLDRSMTAPASGRSGAPPFAPFASGDFKPVPRTDPPPDSGPKPSAGIGSQSESPLQYDKPDGWREGQMKPLRWAALLAGPDDAVAELTIIPAGGDLRANVARWLRQVRGGDAPDEIIEQAMGGAMKVQVDGHQGSRFYLVSGETNEDPLATAIDATIVPLENGTSLFIKMTGPERTVEKQADKVGEFLASLKLKL